VSPDGIFFGMTSRAGEPKKAPKISSVRLNHCKVVQLGGLEPPTSCSLEI
jgi:hypothetical protein